MEIKEAYNYCKKLTEGSGPHFSVGFRFLPPHKRKAIYAVYAFCRYADDIVDEKQEKPIEVLLKEWEEELDRCYRNEATHAITIALSDVLKHFPIPKSGFMGLIEGCRMDLEVSRYRRFEDLLVYCDLVATTIRDLSLPIFGYSDPAGIVHGRALSTALQLTNIVRDVGEDLDRGRIYLPLDELNAAGYSEKELLNRTQNDAFEKVILFQCERVRRYFEEAALLVPMVEADSQLALSLMRNVYVALIDRIEKNPRDVLTKKLRLSLSDRAKVVTRTFLDRGLTPP